MADWLLTEDRKWKIYSLGGYMEEETREKESRKGGYDIHLSTTTLYRVVSNMDMGWQFTTQKEPSLFVVSTYYKV